MSEDQERRLRRLEVKVDVLLTIIGTAMFVWLVSDMSAQFMNNYHFAKWAADCAGLLCAAAALWLVQRRLTVED